MQSSLCKFYERVGSCRHGNDCVRVHRHPKTSSILMIPHLYAPLAASASSSSTTNTRQEKNEVPSSSESDASTSSTSSTTSTSNTSEVRALRRLARKQQKHFDAFFADIFGEFDKFGRVLEMQICCNETPHLRGAVFVRYSNCFDALTALLAMRTRFYDGRAVRPQLSPIGRMGSARCSQFDAGICTREATCNFLHLYSVPPHLQTMVDDDPPPPPQHRPMPPPQQQHHHRHPHPPHGPPMAPPPHFYGGPPQPFYGGAPPPPFYGGAPPGATPPPQQRCPRY
jgi:RNA recognition motif/Zinc finger C-x8-C-x5-C-x3-H type (and similar)